MALFRTIVEQRVLANLLFFVLLAAGLMVVAQMPVEEYPNVALDKILITVPWPGAAPEDIERLIARKVEEKIDEVQDIEWIQSSALPDRCEVWVKVRDDAADFQTVYRDIQTEISKLRDLPQGSQDPIVTKIDVEEMQPVLQVLVSWGGDPSESEIVKEERLRQFAKNLDALLEQVPQVKKVRVYGIRDRELKILIDPARLQHYQLTIDDVALAVQARNVNLPAGSLEGAGREILVRSRSEPESIGDFSEVVLRAVDQGPSVRLKDVAELRWGFEKGQVRSRFRGQKCITLAIVKEESGNAVSLVRDVRARLAQVEAEKPADIRLEIIADTSTRILERIAVLQWNIVLGLVMVLFILWISIGFRNAILGSLGIPFSFLCSLILLHIGGQSINIISLFSMVLVLGVIVDDALVVLENIHRHSEMGKDIKQAVVEGASEVAIPVVSATLTTVAAFLPLLLMPGSTGKFFAIIPITVTYALVASLFECLVILPVHILDFSPEVHSPQSSSTDAPASGRLVSKLRQLYSSALRACLRLRYLSILFILVLTIGAMVLLGQIRVLFFPSDYKQFFVNIKMPVGASLDETEAMAARIGEMLDASPEDEIESAIVNIGFYFDANYKPHTETHFAQAFVTVANSRLRSLSVQQIMARTRAQIAKAQLVNAEIEVVELNEGPPLGKPVTIRLRGDDLGRLWQSSLKTKELIGRLPGLSNVNSDMTLGKDELHYKLDDESASRQGITASQVSRALAFANDGAVLTTWSPSNQDETIDVRVQYQAQRRRQASDLSSIRLRNRNQALVPLEDVVHVERQRGFSAIHRFESQRAITVTADIDPAQITAVKATELARQAMRRALTDDSILVDFEGEYAETNRSFGSLKISFIVAVGCIFMVLGAQFRSFLQPLVVLLTVPFSFIGVVYGLWLLDDPFTMVSGVAIVGLAGMVVNDSLVLVDFVNRKRDDGVPVVEALCSGAENRMRAILLTTVTTVFGVLPMAIGLGGRSTVWSPMATSIAFGLSFATVLTLFIIPCFYLILEDLLALFGQGERPDFRLLTGPSLGLHEDDSSVIAPR